MSSNKLHITTPTDLEIVINRSFDAPRELVFEAMTRPELIRQWLFLPPGWEMTVCEDDARVGGSFRWAWNGPDGKPGMAMSGKYRDVVPPERIVRTESFELGCDSRTGEQLVTMLLAEQGGKTHLTLTIRFPSREARDGMLASGMERGMSAGYEKLDAMLKARMEK